MHHAEALQEVEKLQWRTIWGADTIIDLSAGHLKTTNESFSILLLSRLALFVKVFPPA
jgi:thiamine biosynthesis protein ThiC